MAALAEVVVVAGAVADVAGDAAMRTREEAGPTTRAPPAGDPRDCRRGSTAGAVVGGRSAGRLRVRRRQATPRIERSQQEITPAPRAPPAPVGAVVVAAPAAGDEDRGNDESWLHPDDPPNTVVKVREARDEVQAVKGSTRLEAKRQRRREGRDDGRRKRNVITEAEFLARRESVKRSMVVREHAGRTQNRRPRGRRAGRALCRPRRRRPRWSATCTWARSRTCCLHGGRVRGHRQGPQRRAVRR